MGHADAQVVYRTGEALYMTGRGVSLPKAKRRRRVACCDERPTLTAPDSPPGKALVRKLQRLMPLTVEEVHAVSGLPMTMKVLLPGEDIVREGDRPSQACFILEGWVYSYKLIEKGKRQILSFHLPGDLPDVLNLRMKTSDFSLATLTPTKIARIPYPELEAVTLRHGAVMAAFWHLTLIDAAIFREKVANLGRRSATERLAHLFCEVYVRQRALGLADDRACACPITQEIISDALGITSVHVNRVLRDLRKGGLYFAGGRLSTPSWERLMASAHFDPAYLRLDLHEPI